MSDEHLFLITSTAFRIAVIAAGVCAVFLGYRLLLRDSTGNRSSGGGPESTDASAKFGKVSVSLTRLAPGSVFALFGMTLVAVMVKEGAPQYQLTTSAEGGRTVTMRSEEGVPDGQLARANRLLRDGKREEALKAYQEFTGSFAMSANNMADILSADSRFEEAVTLSRLATALSPQNHEYLDTLLTALAKSGQTDEAKRELKRAMDLAPSNERADLAVLSGKVQ